MLQHCVDFALLDTFRHHVHEIGHDGSTQLEIEVRFDTLLGDSLGHTLRVTTFELSAQQVTKPSLQQWNDTTKEEEPHAPRRRPETTSWTLADRARVEAVVNQMLKSLQDRIWCISLYLYRYIPVS